MAAVASYACQFQLGAILGQSSNMLPQLQAADSPIQIDYDSATWIGKMQALSNDSCNMTPCLKLPSVVEIEQRSCELFAKT